MTVIDHTLNRRRFLAAAAAAMGSAAYLNMTGAVLAQGTDTIVLGLSARGIRTLDPHKVLQGIDYWSLGHIHDKLFDLPNYRFPTSIDELDHRLATSFSASEDSKTWTIQLREGVQFHGGRGVMTSEDVKYSFDRLRDANRIGIAKPLMNNVAEISVDGPNTVIFQLEHPDPLFVLTALTAADAVVLSKAFVEEVGDDALATQAVGTGPYVLETLYQDPSQGVSIIANNDHFAGPPATPRLHMRYIADTTARTLALLSGEVHMIDGVRAPGWVPSMQQRDPNLEFDIVRPGSLFNIHFNLDQAPFDNILVRQAICHAIDRDQIVAAMAPFGDRIYGLNPTIVPGAFTAETVPADVAYGYDPEKAKALLAEAGHPGGLTFGAYTSQREDYSSVMLMIQEQLRAVGINMDLELKDHTSFHADQSTGTNTISQVSGPLAPVPEQVFVQYLSAETVVKTTGGGGFNFSRYGVAIPGIDDDLNAVREEADPARRAELVQAMEVKALKDAVMLPISANGFMMVRTNRLDMGFVVESGYVNWPLWQAKLT